MSELATHLAARDIASFRYHNRGIGNSNGDGDYLATVVIGLDPHKKPNTVAVVQRDETLLIRRRFEHSDDGLAAKLAAVGGYPKRAWAVEGANGIGLNIAQKLVTCGERVVDVPAKLATHVREYSNGHGTKTDDTDALAIARAAIHSRHLRYLQPGGSNEALKLLSDRRSELVQARTHSVCRLHRLLRELIAGGARLSLNAEHAFGQPTRCNGPRHRTWRSREATTMTLDDGDAISIDETRIMIET